MDIIISHLNFNLKHHDNCRSVLKLISLATTSNLFSSEVVQKCQYCQLCVLREIPILGRLIAGLFILVSTFWAFCQDYFIEQWSVADLHRKLSIWSHYRRTKNSWPKYSPPPIGSPGSAPDNVAVTKEHVKILLFCYICFFNGIDSNLKVKLWNFRTISICRHM